MDIVVFGHVLRQVKSPEQALAPAGWLLWLLVSGGMILGSFLLPLLVAMAILEYLFAGV